MWCGKREGGRKGRERTQQLELRPLVGSGLARRRELLLGVARAAQPEREQVRLPAQLVAEQHADVGREPGHVRGAHDGVGVLGQHPILQAHRRGEDAGCHAVVAGGRRPAA